MSYVDSDADSGMCICCPNVDDKIAMKTLKDPEREKSIQNMVQNGNIPAVLIIL
jgi:muramidase (phage lysozyme)